MALSESVLNELERELVELRRRRLQIDSAIKGLKGVLAAGRQRDPSHDRASGAVVADRAMPRMGGAGRQVSLRARIIEIIGTAARPDRALVVEQLRQEGFRVSGATSLPIRVSHELSRLRRAGALRKDRNGLVDSGGEGAGCVGRRSSRGRVRGSGLVRLSVSRARHAGAKGSGFLASRRPSCRPNLGAQRFERRYSLRA